jgi:pimeloyl-ACP methyl ester carboxylesterase
MKKPLLYHKIYHLSEDADWVVFVHGAGGSSAVWFKQIKSYKKHFNLLLIDLRGHGRSPAGPELGREDYSFESIASDLIEVLDHRNIRKAHFVGVSLGTIIVRQLVDLRPEYVKTMILVGAVTKLSFKSRFLVSMGRTFKSVIPYMWLYKFFAFIIMPLDGHEESRNTFVREAQKLAQKEFIRWFNLTRQFGEKMRIFEEVDPGVPTLYVMGDQDHMFLQPIHNLVARFKSQTLHVVERCGHVVNIEKPEVFNELSIRFLKSRTTA